MTQTAQTLNGPKPASKDFKKPQKGRHHLRTLARCGEMPQSSVNSRNKCQKRLRPSSYGLKNPYLSEFIARATPLSLVPYIRL